MQAGEERHRGKGTKGRARRSHSSSTPGYRTSVVVQVCKILSSVISHRPATLATAHTKGTFCSVQPTIQPRVHRRDHCVAVLLDAQEILHTHTQSLDWVKKGVCGTASLIKSDSSVISGRKAQQLWRPPACTHEEHHHLISLLFSSSLHTCCSTGHASPHVCLSSSPLSSPPFFHPICFFPFHP